MKTKTTVKKLSVNQCEELITDYKTLYKGATNPEDKKVLEATIRGLQKQRRKAKVEYYKGEVFYTVIAWNGYYTAKQLREEIITNDKTPGVWKSDTWRIMRITVTGDITNEKEQWNKNTKREIIEKNEIK